MKRILQSILAITLLITSTIANAQTRYLDDTFSSVTITSNVTYGTNISILAPCCITILSYNSS